jgi:hypothetical protein
VGARVCFCGPKRLGVTNPQLFYLLFRNPVRCYCLILRARPPVQYARGMSHGARRTLRTAHRQGAERGGDLRIYNAVDGHRLVCGYVSFVLF